MSSPRWQNLERIFADALDRPDDERVAFVRRECGNDAELEAQILQLLAADAKAGNFLELGLEPSMATRLLLPLLPAGKIIGERFEIQGLIGQGGMGQVYEAVDRELSSRVALKLIRPEISSDPRVISRFRREVQLSRMITHPNVCRTFDLERLRSDDGGQDFTFLTMELLQGETLDIFLRRNGPLTIARALPLVRQMIDALAAAHSMGVIHRDFKPSNVVLVEAESGIRVVVTDFGLARALPGAQTAAENLYSTVTGAQGFMGTLAYMAPEQFERGETSVASDIYSLGLVMYEMVTGQRPFADKIPFAEAARRVKDAAPSPKSVVPDLDRAWDEAIGGCLATDSKGRFSSVTELAEALVCSDSLGRFQMRTIAAPLRTKATARPSKWKIAAAISVAAMSLLAIGLRLYWKKAESSNLAVGSNILVARIENATGDSELTGVSELLKNDLSQSKYVNLLEPTRLKEDLARMSKPPDTILEPRIGREVAWRAKVPLVVFGTVSRVAEDYKLDLKAELIGNDPSRAKNSWNFSETATNKKELFQVVRNGGTWLRKLTGETANDIENADRNLEDVTTNSWEALALYAEGQHLAFLDREDDAVLLYKRAVEKDPEFAMAWMRLGDTLDTLGRSAEGFVCWRKALAVAGDRRLTPREELRIKGMYASDTGDLKAAIDYFAQYSLEYPNDYIGFFDRGAPLMFLGRTEEAIQVLYEAQKREPDLYYIPDHLARYHLILGNLSEVRRFTAQVRQLKHPWWADEVDGQADAMSGNYDAAKKKFDGLAGADDPFLRSVRFYLEASSLADQGRDDEALETLKIGEKADLPTGDASDRADKLLGMAYLHFRKGERMAAREAAIKSMEAEPSVRRAADVGSLLARAGFVSEAQGLLNGLDPKDKTVANQVALQRLKGEIFLGKNFCQPALDALRRAKSLDQERALLHDYWGHALLACGRPQEAEMEFNGLSRRPGQVWHQPEAYMPGWTEYLNRGYRSPSRN